jgi:glycopeptide antibiotics resistance protein
MMLLINVLVILFVPVTTYILFSIVEGAKNKIVTLIGGAAAFMLIVYLLPEKTGQNVSTASSASSTFAPREAPSKVIVLTNYREKGDSVQLECSGTTGNITCKPKK